MDYKFFLREIPAIILSPRKVLESVRNGAHPVKHLRINLLLPVLILVAICAFIGSWLLANPILHPAYWMLTGVKYFLLDLAVVYLSALIYHETGKAMDLQADFSISLTIIVYSLIPFFLCQMVSLLFESLAFINILSLYGLWIMWLAGEIILDPPAHKKMPLLIASMIVIAELYVGFSIGLTSLIDRIYFALFV
jgi:hypothetical protein